MAQLIDGAGLSVSECIGFGVKDIDFYLKISSVHNGKGGKDRTTLLPEQVIKPLIKSFT